MSNRKGRIFMPEKKKFKAPAPVAWSNEPVVTTKILADYFECSIENIKKNFQNNSERFIEGKDFFKLSGDALKQFKDRGNEIPAVGKNANLIYLWTRWGAFRHAKILNNDKAWEIYEKLVEFYFDHEKFQYNQARENSKTSNKNFKEVIKKFAAYAKAQGTSRLEVAFYSKYSRLCNKLAGLPNKGGRDNATIQQLGACTWIENLMSEFFIGGMKKILPYKEIENRVKAWAEQFLSILQMPLKISA